jgi:hypothetical protein
MEKRPYTKAQIISACVVALALIIYGISLTSQAFNQAREQVNRNGVEEIQRAINLLLEKGTNLNKSMPECSDGWCELDSRILLSYFINDDNDPPTQLLSQNIKTNSGDLYQLKVTGESSYIIKGNSAKSESLCWVASDDKNLSNISKDSPTPCPQ